MAIELTYGEVGLHEQGDVDRAILRALGAKPGYCIELTYADGRTEDVVIDSSPTGERLYAQRFVEEHGEAVGPRFAVDADEIAAIKVY